MAGAVAMGSGAHLNRALKDLQKSFPHNLGHNYQDFFLKRVRESIGVLLGLPTVAGCFDTEYFCTEYFVAECFDTEYFCTEYFVADCFGTEDFCTEDFVAGWFCAECFVAGCFVVGWFCAGYFAAERSDSDLLAESIAIFPELD